MIELTPLERLQFRWAARRERIRRKFRRTTLIGRSARLEAARRQLEKELADDFMALKEAQRISPQNDQLRRMAESPDPSVIMYVGDVSWD